MDLKCGLKTSRRVIVDLVLDRCHARSLSSVSCSKLIAVPHYHFRSSWVWRPCPLLAVRRYGFTPLVITSMNLSEYR
jgi:hypothetical protein